MDTYNSKRDSLNFDLHYDDFLEHLVSSTNFKYNYYRMWIREILIEWAAEITTSDLFEQETSQDILPMWINYMISKLRAVQPESCEKFCRSLKSDSMYFYKLHDGEDFLCFRKDIVADVLQRHRSELQEDSSFDNPAQDTEDLSDAVNYEYQEFEEKFCYLVGLVRKTFSTAFKFTLLMMAFGTEKEKPPQTIMAPYMLHFPSKYVNVKDSDIYRVAKAQSQIIVEHFHHYSNDDSSSNDEAEEARSGEEKSLEIKQASYIMPLLKAQNVNDEFWDVQKLQDENRFY